MADICIHAFVTGIVQGVWYRQSTKQQADAQDVTGWARNLADGRVEVLLCGEETAVKRVESWLQEGPPRAIVQKVESEQVAWQSIRSFETG